MSVRLTFFALLSGASMLSAATFSERLNRLELEVAQLRSLLQKMTGEELARPIASRPRTAMKEGRTHHIRSGDSYWSIARRYKTTVNALQAANPGVDPRRLTIGKRISIPSGDQSLPTPTSSGTYRVKSGDILGRISEAHGIRLHQLLSANPGLNPRKLKIGTILTIPGQPTQPVPLANAAPEPDKTNPGQPRTSEDSKPANQTARRPNPYLSDTSGYKQAKVREPEEAELDKPRLIVIEEDLRFADIAKRYHTTVANLNRLNKRELSPKQMIKGGSQLYVPTQ